jgi:hypothetical protein
MKQTLGNIYQVEFPINIRRDKKTKVGREKDYYSVYEALAFYNTNSIEGESDED